MKRRDFLRTAGLATAILPFSQNGYAIQALSEQSYFSKLAETAGSGDRIMVFIELNGGNDGLNTLIPLDQYTNLAKHRPRTLIPKSDVLKLSGVSGTGLHPSMAGMRSLFDNGLLSVVQNVGYPNQDYSHFRSMDIWQTAASTSNQLNTGWMGRYLSQDHPTYPSNYPNTANPDPLAIQIGIVAPVSLMGPSFPMGVSVGNPDEVYNLVNDLVEPAPNDPYGQELTYIRTVMQQTKEYFDVIKVAATKGQNVSTQYPPQGQNPLADQLQVVAKLIDGGLKTRIYLVTLGGFDTHSEQSIAGMPKEGNHSNLLKWVSEAVAAFQDDLNRIGRADDVCGMTYSEFGRTIADNDSLGTDHGAAAPLFVFGKSVNPGIIGQNAIIPIDLDDSSDVPMQHDFRSVYATVLKDWFQLATPQDVLSDTFPILPIFKASVATNDQAQKGDLFGLGNYPNPVQMSTNITFSIPSGIVSLTLFDAQGAQVRKLIDNSQYQAGTHQVVLNRSDIPSGTYFYQLRLNGMSVSKKMIVI
jgi:uncharacterized protein (DUF1501 family)